MLYTLASPKFTSKRPQLCDTCSFLVSRARISQLEAEAAEHSSRLAEVESRAASGLRAEQEACLKKISDAETRRQVFKQIQSLGSFLSVRFPHDDD